MHSPIRFLELPISLSTATVRAQKTPANMAREKTAKLKDSTAHLGFEAKLWLTADKLRNNMDAAEYKHVVLGLIFLKYISDTAGKCRRSNAEIRIRNSRPLRHSKFVIRRFPVPAEARWSPSRACGTSAKQPTGGMANAEVRMWN